MTTSTFRSEHFAAMSANLRRTAAEAVALRRQDLKREAQACIVAAWVFKAQGRAGKVVEMKERYAVIVAILGE